MGACLPSRAGRESGGTNDEDTGISRLAVRRASMERLVLSVWLAIVAATLAGCADDDRVVVPAGFPNLPVPAGNMLTEARVEPGRRLFYDRQVSRAGEVACTSCVRSTTSRSSVSDEVVRAPLSKRHRSEVRRRANGASCEAITSAPG